jgi:hypothetical protein
LIGDLGHGTDDNHGLAVNSLLHYTARTLNGGGVHHGGAAKFHYDHGKKVPTWDY